MKRNKSCSNCSIGTTNNFNKDILCRFKGVVSRDYICPKYRAMAQTGKRLSSNNRCIDCEFFILDSSGSDTLINIGYCQLFTVRQFNGESKNACSKFCPKTELFIS
jgi:hypothetical protein